MIGHNKPSFDEIVEENIRRGLLLTIKDAYQTLSRDPRAEKRHFRVLAEIIECMNIADFGAARGLAWPGRRKLAEMTADEMRPDGYSEATIAKTIQELMTWGYIVQDRRPPISGGRPLSHYSIGKPSVEDLQSEISAWVREQRKPDNRRPFPARNGERPLSVNGNGEPALSVKNNVGNQQFTNNEERPLSVRISGEAPLSVIGQPPVKQGEISSEERPLSVNNGECVLPTVRITKKDNSTAKDADAEAHAVAHATDKRGTRLPENWTLPDEWRGWALANFRITINEAAHEARTFANYWQAAPGAKARKLDWYKTWQNWCSRAFSKRVRPQPLPQSGLFDAPASQNVRDAFRAVRDSEADF